jgi:hypothetical protein
MSPQIALPVSLPRPRNIQPQRHLPAALKPAAWMVGRAWSTYLSGLRIEVRHRALAPDQTDEPSLFTCWSAKSFLISEYMREGNFKYLTFTDLKHLFFQTAVGFPESGRLPFAEHQSAHDMVRFLRRGTSVLSLADGPYGPPGELKAGILAVALRTGCPITAVRIDVDRSLRLKRRWDQYEVPLPLANVEVDFLRIPTRGRRLASLHAEVTDLLGTA